MTTHIVISDTHAPDIISDVFSHVKSHALSAHNPDAIVINGDLLGVFSMSGSSVYKRRAMTSDDKKRFVEMGAPDFFSSYGMPSSFSSELALSYVRSRYWWMLSILADFASLRHTFFTMGNHESPLHFLVLSEIPFVFGCDVPPLPPGSLQAIFDEWESAVHKLDNVTFLREKPIVHKDVLLIPIPGESHDAVGSHAQAVAQEKRTQSILDLARPLVSQTNHIVVYNHTQGSYDRSTSWFSPVSPSAKKFLSEVSSSRDVVWVQSHNHWSYTQFLVEDKVHFVLNNAGLHGGIYNVLTFADSLSVFDLSVSSSRMLPVIPSTDQLVSADDVSIIARNYPQFLDVFVNRRLIVSRKH